MMAAKFMSMISKAELARFLQICDGFFAAEMDIPNNSGRIRRIIAIKDFMRGRGSLIIGVCLV